MAENLRADRALQARFWPFGVRMALFLVPLLLSLLLLAWGLGRELLHLDSAPVGFVLLGIVLLSLIPVVLLLLEGLASSGGSIEVGQVKIALTAAAVAQTIVVAPRNVTPDTNIRDSASAQIIDGLRQARSRNTVVVNLEDGHAWWESRLLILCAGAVRLGKPIAIAFTATRSGKPLQFAGWGHPTEIQERILRANPDYAEAYGRAMGVASAARQHYGLGDTPPSAVTDKAFIVQPSGTLNPFLEEQLLANNLGYLETQPREIGVGRLQDMLAPVLHVGSVDRTDFDAEWFKKALRSDEEYVALTDSGTYVALMTRANVVSEVLLALTHG